VKVRFKLLNGVVDSDNELGLLLSKSLSSRLGPKPPSLMSVLLLRRDGGGVDIFGSSLKNCVFPVGDANGLLDRRTSDDSLRLVPGRDDGELPV